MKLISFNGSPRNDGTTQYILQQLTAGANSAGVTTRHYNLNDLNFKGCQGCRKCKTEGACDLQDDLAPVYDEILSADIMVLGSPVYMAYVTGQAKLFLDRLYAFKDENQVSKLPKGKKCILVLTQGYSDTQGYQTLVNSISSLLSRFGFEVLPTMVVGGVYKPEDEPAQIMGKAAYDLGASLMK